MKQQAFGQQVVKQKVMKENVVFFDNKNGFCNRAMATVRALDRKKELMITSINGKKAQMLFQGNYGFLRSKNTIVFVEGQRVWVRSNAILRLLWLFGDRKWKILGALYVIPGFLTNPFFRLLTRIVPNKESEK